MSTQAPVPPDADRAPAPAASWTQEDARLLLALREGQGLNEAVFAKANAISLAQLRALEDRGESPFYSEAIKAQIGWRLLRRLGHEPHEHQLPLWQQAMAGLGHRIQDEPADDPLGIPLPQERRGRGLGAAAVALVAFACGAWALGALQQKPPAATMAQVPAPVGPSTEAVAVPGTADTLQPAQAAPVDLLKVAAPAPAVAMECSAALRTQAVAFTPDLAVKAAGYVHVEARGPASLCVVDARERSTVAELQAGESRSIHGEPPFIVRAVPASAVRLYFQGARAPLPTGDSTVTLLLPRPAP